MDAACLPAARQILAATMPPPLGESLARWEELDEAERAVARADLARVAGILAPR